MITKLFFVFVLSFGPFSHIEFKDTASGLTLKQADFHAVEFPELFGLEPISSSTLDVVGQMAPFFAGAKTNSFLPKEAKNTGFGQPKKKLTGYISWRMEIIPPAAKFSGAVKSASQSTSHAT